jgi:hypothetical protein
MKYKGKERDFQRAIAGYLNSKSALFVHVPNEGKRSAIAGRQLVLQGLSKGCPDILIFDRNEQYNGFAIELKVGYNKASDEQLRWLDNLALRGWKTLISNDIDEVLHEIDAYFK